MPYQPRPPSIPFLDQALHQMESGLRSARNLRNKGYLTDYEVERIREIRTLILNLIDTMHERGFELPPSRFPPRTGNPAPP